MNPNPKNLFLWLSILVLFGLISCKPDPPTPPPPSQSFNNGIKLIEDEFQGVPLILAGSSGRNLIVSFERRLEDGTEPSFLNTQAELPIIMEDSEGNMWDIFGEAVEGPRKGQKLRPVRSYMGYWFSFGTFFPGAEIFGDNQDIPNGTHPPASNNWLVSTSEVFFGTGKDGIPSIELPTLMPFREREFLEEPFYLGDDDLVIGIKFGNTYRAYPHPILDWHEVVNDTIGDKAFSIVYCPLTGTGMAWNRVINGTTTTFGVSGLLYNNNVVPYDRATDSNWSQMRGDCVNGNLIGMEAEHFQIVETSWKTWRDMHNIPMIMSTETGFDRDYTDYPYGNYKSSDNVSFPVTFNDQRLHRKERVHGVIINGEAKVYRLGSF